MRVWGQAKSYSKITDSETCIANDHDVIASLSLLWVLIHAYMPVEIVSAIEDLLTEAGMPRVATRNVAEGKLSFCNI
jgi:hypothetical protein